MESNNKYTCPCCGYKVFEETPGSDDICPICFWHDDLIDLETMYEPMGPNKVSLEQAQKNYAEFGAKEKRLVENVRPATNFEKDENWRMLDRIKDTPKDIDPEAKEPSDLYYWYWN
jgi:hypothetical protein